MAPLARDPVPLVLHTVARALPGMTSAQDALVEVLCAPHSRLGPLLPGWLYRLITGVREVGESWAMARGLGDLWRSQTLLSTVATALIFYSRTSVAAESRDWFLRLADCAMRTYFVESDREPAPVDPDQPTPRGAVPDEWIGRLCESLPRLRRAAAGTPLSHQIEALVAQARRGNDKSQALSALHREVGEAESHRPFDRGPPNAYTCPFRLCPRRLGRGPGSAGPLCHLRRSGTPMRRD